MFSGFILEFVNFVFSLYVFQHICSSLYGICNHFAVTTLKCVGIHSPDNALESCVQKPECSMPHPWKISSIYSFIRLYWCILQMFKKMLIRALSNADFYMYFYSIIWELWCQKQVSRAWINNNIPWNTVGCNYCSLSWMPACGSKVFIYHLTISVTFYFTTQTIASQWAITM